MENDEVVGTAQEEQILKSAKMVKYLWLKSEIFKMSEYQPTLSNHP